MDCFEDNSRIIYGILGMIILALCLVFIPPLIRKLIGKSYKKVAKVSEDDFANNGPRVVKKSEKEENVNDN